MDRRAFLRGAGAWAVGTACGPFVNLGRVAAGGCVEVSARAVDLVASSTVVDMLGLLTLDWAKLRRWQGDPSAFTAEDFWALAATGVDLMHPAVDTDSADPHRAALRWLERWSALNGGQPCFLSPVEDVADLARTPKRGQIGLMIGFQNSNHLRSVSDVWAFFERGQRVSQLTYNERNRLGSGCRVARDTGLTGFGAEVIAAMNEVGMVVDVSHCGDRTTLDAIAASRMPVLATHTGCRALVPGQPRNKPDEAIRRLAAGGGVIGLTLVGAFVARRSPTLESFLDHVDHIAGLVGIEHVGLGTDVSADATVAGSTRPLPAYAVAGVDLRWRVYQIVDGLLGRGYAARDVELVLGGNFLRALADVWHGGEWRALPRDGLRRDPFCAPGRPLGRVVPRCDAAEDVELTRAPGS